MKELGTVLIFIIVIVIVIIMYTQLYSQNSIIENIYTRHPKHSLRISVKEARAKRFGLIVDVRTHKERNLLGFYPLSIPISIHSLRSELPLDISNKRTPILVYSNGDSRAAEAASIIYQMGYHDVSYIDKPYLALMPGSQ